MMLRTIVAVLALAIGSFAVTAAVEPPPEGVAYAIDGVHSKALFRVSGSVMFDRGVEIRMDVAIRTESVDSGNKDLDKHLMSPDFFNAKEPSCATMSFKSSGCSMGDKGIYMVTGDLTIHGVTKQVTVPVEFTGAADMGRGARAGFETTFSIKRSEYGMNWGVEKGMLGDEVRITVALEGVEAKADEAGGKK